MTNMLACGCQDASHAAAEQRILDELPTYRRKWVPRQPGEGPHEYIARFWADERVVRAATRDIDLAFGWAKEDE